MRVRLLIAKSAGFCFGVRRAMEMAFDAARKVKSPLFSLGPLIHNPQAVASLGDLGIEVRERIDAIPGGTVIFRSHGVSLGDFQEARKKRLRVIDATCPIVKRAQRYTKFLHRRGYPVLIVGDANHPEVEAIRSYLGERAVVVNHVQALVSLGPWEKLGVIAQTTQSSALFKEIVATVMDKAKEVRVFNTICQATAIRQTEAVEIARKVDAMIVIGGYNSGNTQRLAAICREIQPRTYHVETAREIAPEWLAGREKVGLTAGASTPSWVIEEVSGEVRRLGQRRKKRVP
jgi:4-hydroxy-3-methylbut-2-en-1-yl diphosphate reductase